MDDRNLIRMFGYYKVQPCFRGEWHDIDECPYHHPGETARRRDPLLHYYFGIQCLEFKTTGLCRYGDYCELAHGPFEAGLHPCHYRTKRCPYGESLNCGRRVCFFAHTDEELRHWHSAVGDYLRHHRRMPPMTVYHYGWVQDAHRLFNHPRPNVDVSRAFNTYVHVFY
ncbi:CCCH-type zinc finger protein with ARM repeat domain-containing protein [Perilla frutescens var. hirtella]|nr:CCCH-type zinc finger protein with ARM repeat domain-containing protein [Perilla frutescens var. frutescens]KAH6794618.1 CCCH-type zinc finger protein with ARM repeat domain-containing protein [Perilla frutescens var. hirtella]